MTTSASAPTNKSPFDFFHFDLPVTQPTQDVDLIKQLPFIPGLKEVLMLRQVHALEHATVWVLSESKSYSKSATNFNARQIDAVRGVVQRHSEFVDNDSLGGLSTDQGFYLYGDVNLAALRQAVHVAQHRLIDGEWDLAVHPRCGTNVSVGMLMMAGLVVGIHFLLPLRPIEQLLGLGVAATAAAQLAPELGTLAQRYLTTAIPFNLEIEDITVTRDIWGQSAHLVQVRWQE